MLENTSSKGQERKECLSVLTEIKGKWPKPCGLGTFQASFMHFLLPYPRTNAPSANMVTAPKLT